MDELNVLIGLDSWLASLWAGPLPAPAAILSLGLFLRQGAGETLTLAVHKSISFGSLDPRPFIDLPSHGGLEGSQQLQGEFNFFASMFKLTSASSNHLPAPCLCWTNWRLFLPHTQCVFSSTCSFMKMGLRAPNEEKPVANRLVGAKKNFLRGV